mgnify:FL=1|tara:strand:+ start:2836 stop:3225 length:390 start_codon:yes stop_codon:yes gene_type:complete
MSTKEKPKSKTALQKLYEKWIMIQLEAQSSKLMLAKRDGHWGVYLVINNIPVAKLLTHAELIETEPKFKPSEVLQDGLEKLMDKDPRFFNHVSGHKTIDLDQLDEYGGDGFEQEFQPLIDELLTYEAKI